MAYNGHQLTNSITYIAMCIALLSICAWMTIPFPVRFTLQIMALLMIGFLSDLRHSVLTVSGYLVLGLCGAPVFAGFGSGPSILFGYTGGYLMAFLPAVLIIGLCKRLFGNHTGVWWLSALLALSVCYAMGAGWYYFIYTRAVGSLSAKALIATCILPFLLPDLIKTGLAILLAKKLRPHIKTP